MANSSPARRPRCCRWRSGIFCSEVLFDWLFSSGPDFRAAQRAGAALNFNFGFATRYQPALVGLAVIGVVDTAGPNPARILFHRKNADADDLAAAQARVRILV